MSASVHHEPRFEPTEADRLGERISELYAYINAATAEFIVRRIGDGGHQIG